MPMNMSYCRFENTVRALRECHEASPYGEGIEELSDTEQVAWEDLQDLMAEMLQEAGYDVYPPGEHP